VFVAAEESLSELPRTTQTSPGVSVEKKRRPPIRKIARKKRYRRHVQRRLSSIGLALVAMTTGCATDHVKAATAKVKEACRDSIAGFGSPAATEAAQSAARLAPKWRSVAVDFQAAQQAASQGRAVDPTTIGPVLGRLSDDCSALGISLGRPLGGG
jgi:hypothetical protein